VAFRPLEGDEGDDEGDLVEAQVFQKGRKHTHDGPAGDKARGDEGTLFTAFVVDCFILGGGGDQMGNEAAGQQRGVQLEGNVHAEGKSQRRYADHLQDQGEDGSDRVEQPGGRHVGHPQ